MIHGILFQVFALQNEVKNKQLLRWRACNHERCIENATCSYLQRRGEKQHPKVTTFADSLTSVAMQARIHCIHVESTVLNVLPHLFWFPPHYRSQHLQTEKIKEKTSRLTFRGVVFGQGGAWTTKGIRRKWEWKVL